MSTKPHLHVSIPRHSRRVLFSALPKYGCTEKGRKHDENGVISRKKRLTGDEEGGRSVVLTRRGTELYKELHVDSWLHVGEVLGIFPSRVA